MWRCSKSSSSSSLLWRKKKKKKKTKECERFFLFGYSMSFSFSSSSLKKESSSSSSRLHPKKRGWYLGSFKSFSRVVVVDESNTILKSRRGNPLLQCVLYLNPNFKSETLKSCYKRRGGKEGPFFHCALDKDRNAHTHIVLRFFAWHIRARAKICLWWWWSLEIVFFSIVFVGVVATLLRVRDCIEKEREES